MKLLKLAIVAATLALPNAPISALAGQGITELPAVAFVGKDLAERRSGRCPSGEGRPFVSGCGGV